jgi:actin-related protein
VDAEVDARSLREDARGLQLHAKRKRPLTILSISAIITVDDFDLLEKVWEHAFKTTLRVDPKEHPLLISEPAFVTREARSKIAELALEKFGFPAVYLCKSAVLTAYVLIRFFSTRRPLWIPRWRSQLDWDSDS